MWLNVPCKHRQRKGTDAFLDPERKTAGIAAAISFFFLSFLLSILIRGIKSNSHMLPFFPHIFFFHVKYYRLHFYNSFLTVSLFFYYGGRMARKAYNIQAIDPRPSLQKKKSQFREGRGGWSEGERRGTGHGRSITLLYQPFPWQPAEQGQRAAMHFAPVWFIYLL